MTSPALQAMHSSERQDWRTPLWFLGLVRRVFQGCIGLDPCTGLENPTRAAAFCTEVGTYLGGARARRVSWDDGLELDWDEFALERGIEGGNFVNFPYADADAWSRKLASVSSETIVLCPCRPETKWAKRLLSWSAGRLDWSSSRYGARVNFDLPINAGESAGDARKSGAAFPAAVYYLGPARGVRRFRYHFGDHGGWVKGGG